MLKTKKYFLSFLVLILIIFTSIAYLGQIDQSFLNQKYKSSNYVISSNKPTGSEDKNKFDQKQDVSFNFNFVQAYPWVKGCNLNSSLFSNFDLSNQIELDYSQPSPSETHEIRIVRGVLVYFPIEQTHNFQYEFRWLYRSWIEMQKYEPTKWRTDLIVFIKNDQKLFNDSQLFFNQLNCSFLHKRQSPLDHPMCTLIDYTPLKDRNLPTNNLNFKNNKELYDFVLKKINIFDDLDQNLNIFYNFLKKRLSTYGYVDSILMGFDGYDYLKKSGYDYLIRSDMDVFLTPLFAKWLPRNCNDFYVGRGGYSSEFNTNRLGRIAANLGFEFASSTNLGSTWYSTPDQFRLVSYLTLFGMAYLSNEEFSQPEREGKLGILLWPDWHYGVLLLYGQNLIMNHLIKTQQLNIIKMIEYLDYPSHYNTDVHKIIHIHVFHGGDMFSKFEFKAGKYDNLTTSVDNPDMAKYYSLRMAIEGKRMSCQELNKLLWIESASKS
ncbi:unnamed protein product [Brachionus calyciflorus]|uniref:DUF7164 domain-containing protein n=1 Tax=Brachionus calyciflorus TaxID=104777 RepID=A0A813SVM5_9BILA|nr:unnamed protein product [Brachionus calyciflorus]